MESVFNQWTKNVKDHEKNKNRLDLELEAARQVIRDKDALEAARQVIRDTKLIERMRNETRNLITVCDIDECYDLYHEKCRKITRHAMAEILSIDDIDGVNVVVSKFGSIGIKRSK